jgi:hypothetical protein
MTGSQTGFAKMQIVYVRTIENQSVIGDEVGLDKSQADAASPRAP